MLANTFHWTLTQYINFALKLSGQPFIVREVKEGFRAYPSRCHLGNLNAEVYSQHGHSRCPLIGLYVPSSDSHRPWSTTDLTSHGLHAFPVGRPCTAKFGDLKFSDHKSRDPRGHPIVVGAFHSRHRYSVFVGRTLFPRDGSVHYNSL